MRIRLTILIVSCVLWSAALARAQSPPAVEGATTGSVDFGGRFTSVDGDEARYERYRDLRDGVTSNIELGKNTSKYFANVDASNIGYRDQRYRADYDSNGKMRLAFGWDSIPLNYSYISSTPWVEQSPAVWTLSSAARQAVQDKVPGVVGVPQNVAQLSQPSIYRTIAQPFDLQYRRDNTTASAKFAARKDVTLDLAFKSSRRDGYRPWAASFAFNNANELPMPLDDRTNDVTAGLEMVKPEGMIRIAYDGSWFDNNIKSFVWDNPLRATDTNPVDPSGYSNGNGAAQGRMSMAPSNAMNVVNVTGLYKMPNHTTLNSSVSFTQNTQNDALIPWTSNNVILPTMPPLPRTTAEAKVQGVNALLNFTSRPTQFFGLTMRYRYNLHDNKTPAFDGTEYVRMDAVPEETGKETEQYDITQNTVDIAGTLNVTSRTPLRLTYTLDDVKRTGRAFSNTTDYTFRTSFDILQTEYMTVRSMYENTRRIGTGFSEMAIEEGGAQPGLRFYDEADRTRNKGTIIFELNPSQTVSLNLLLASGKDKYYGPGLEFGLKDNSNGSYNVGVDLTPNDVVSFGASFGYDLYNSHQDSRNANPPADPTAVPPVAASDYGSWFDPNRNWNMHNHERVNNAGAYLDLIKLAKNTDVRFSYDYMDSDNGFTLGGPRVQELSTGVALSGPSAIVYPGFTIPAPCTPAGSTCFQQLPAVTSTWQRLTVDVKCYFTKKVGVGLGYWFEKQSIADFATLDLPGQPGVPRIDYLGAILTGYGNRPYTGNTAFVRLLYLF
jgi:MtrB/PioB family decaheme-associated outer membrane protein